MSILSKILAGLLLMVSASVFAADYQWEGYSGSLFSDPVSACTDIATRAFSAGSYTYDHYVVYSTTSIRCYGKGSVASGGLVDPIGYTGRVGTGCTAPKVWDTTSLSCAVPAPVCPTSGTAGGWVNYYGTAALDAFCISGCSYRAGMSVGLGGEYASSTVSNGTNCSTNTTGLTPTNPNGQACPTGTTQHGVDLSGTPICAGVGKPPTCWAGSYNVSTDPTIAICVDALPAAKDSAETAKKAAEAAESANAAAKTAGTKEASAVGASQAAGAAGVAGTAAGNAAGAVGGASSVDQAAASAAAAAAMQSANAASASANAARAAAMALGAGSGILPTVGGSGGGGTQLPTDYNREATQQKIAEYLNPAGMPGAAEVGAAMGTQGTALDTAVKAHTDKLSDVVSESGKDASWGWLPSFPSGQCTPFQMGTLPPVDWCPVVPTLKDIAAWLWGLVTALAILAMTQKAIRGN